MKELIVLAEAACSYINCIESSKATNTLGSLSSRGSGCEYEIKRIKPKRKRATAWQLWILQQYYQENRFPTNNERKVLGERIGMTSRAVQIWFQNQRQNSKK